jgi:hypothetical protein
MRGLASAFHLFCWYELVEQNWKDRIIYRNIISGVII